MLAAWFEPSQFPPQFTWMAYLYTTQVNRGRFNSFFNSTFTDPIQFPSPLNFKLNLEPAGHYTEVDVYEVLSSLDPSKAPGPEGIIVQQFSYALLWP